MDTVVPLCGAPKTKLFMAVNNFKLAEPVQVCWEQSCTDREMDNLSRDHQELWTVGIYQKMWIHQDRGLI